jgi:hypothetical protein
MVTVFDLQGWLLRNAAEKSKNYLARMIYILVISFVTFRIRIAAIYNKISPSSGAAR